MAIGYQEPASLSAELSDVLSLSQLEADFDGYGTLPPSLALCRAAAKFVREHTRFIAETTGYAMPTPEISVGASRTVEVYWESNLFEILVTLKEPFTESVFFGRTPNKMSKIQEKFTHSLYQRALVDWVTARVPLREEAVTI